MRTILVLDRQNLVDIAIQYYGTAAAVIDLCQDNNLELDSDITPGTKLLIQDTYPESANSDVADYIQGNSIIVTSVAEPVGDDIGDFLINNEGVFIITNDGFFIEINSSDDFIINNNDDFIITNNNDFITP
jgi:hypothetical protein